MYIEIDRDNTIVSVLRSVTSHAYFHGQIRTASRDRVAEANCSWIQLQDQAA
jgi:hypothetical protein